MAGQGSPPRNGARWAAFIVRARVRTSCPSPAPACVSTSVPRTGPQLWACSHPPFRIAVTSCTRARVPFPAASAQFPRQKQRCRWRRPLDCEWLPTPGTLPPRSPVTCTTAETSCWWCKKCDHATSRLALSPSPPPRPLDASPAVREAIRAWHTRLAVYTSAVAAETRDACTNALASHKARPLARLCAAPTQALTRVHPPAPPPPPPPPYSVAAR
jgi:hypothetical protein